MFKIRETVMVSGIKMITVNILFRIAEIIKVIAQKKDISRIGFACDIFIRLSAINWNRPDSCATCTMNIIARIRLMLCKFTKPSPASPKSNSTILVNLYCSKKTKIKKQITAPAKDATARFTLSVTINKITEIKIIMIKIVLISMGYHSVF